MTLQATLAKICQSGVFGDSYAATAKMEEALDFNPDLPYLVITHEMPDTDAMACIWFINRFIANGNVHVEYVRAGERWPISEGTGYNVIHVDTGFGRFDQHDKKLERGSSFMLLVEHFGYADDAGVKPILEMTRATDNVEKVDDCSVHNVFKTLRGTVKKEDGKTPDWDAILSHVFVTLNSLHNFHSIRAEGAQRFEEVGKLEELKGGIKVAMLGAEPKLRQAAFDKGADVAVWFVHKGRKGFYVGIQVKKLGKDGKENPVRLGKVVVNLRRAEALARNVTIPDAETALFGTLKALPTWFIHDSNKLIASGTDGHPLREDEFTKLSKGKIENIVRNSLTEL